MALDRFFLCAALLLLGGCPPAPLTLVLEFDLEGVDQAEFNRIDELEFIFCREASGCDDPEDFQVDKIALDSPLTGRETINFIPDRSFTGGEPILFHVSATDDEVAPTIEFFGTLKAQLPDPFQAAQKATITLRREASLQNLQDGTVPTNTEVNVSKVFVTAIQQLGGGDFVLFVQEPEGKSPPEHTYPEFAGMRVFLDDVLLGREGINFSPETIQVNDCVAFSGVLQEFNLVTNVENIATFFEVGQCGAFPSPLVIPSSQASFQEIATDTNPNAGNNQPGIKAEIFESVLMQVNNVDVLPGSIANGDFLVSDGSVNNLLIDNFMFQDGNDNPNDGNPLPVQEGQSFSSITGIYSEINNTFRLQPRFVGDLVSP